MNESNTIGSKLFREFVKIGVHYVGLRMNQRVKTENKIDRMIMHHGERHAIINIRGSSGF